MNHAVVTTTINFTRSDRLLLKTPILTTGVGPSLLLATESFLWAIALILSVFSHYHIDKQQYAKIKSIVTAHTNVNLTCESCRYCRG